MAVEIIQPLSGAWHRMVRILSQPFDLGKWFVLGFCAWLATLGDKGGVPSVNFNVGGSPESLGENVRLPDWSEAVLVAIAVGVVVAAIGIGLLMLWLNSRGKFMFIDGIVHNRGAVVEPWRRWRRQGNSLFWWKLLFGLAVLAYFIVVGAIGLLLALPAILTGQPLLAIPAVCVGGLLLLVGIVGANVVGVIIDQFVVPTMYAQGLTTWPAAERLWHGPLKSNPGSFVVVVLLIWVLGLGFGLAMLLTCCVCCLGCIPYIGTVATLPFWVLVRSYGLEFLRQFGPAFDAFAEVEGEPRPPALPEPGDSA